MSEMVFRIRATPLDTARPRWLTAGTLRLLVLCACIVAVGMIRPRLTPHAAGVVVIVGGVAVAAGVAAFLGATRSLSRGARSATMIEMLTAFALLTAYLSSFVDWRAADEPKEDREQ